MKKVLLNIIVGLFLISPIACSFQKAKNITNEEALNILKNIKIQQNVEVTTITETTINNVKSISTQKDIFNEDKYYHMSSTNDLTTKTWYGNVDNILYAFYYTKNSSNKEIKNSSKIESKSASKESLTIAYVSVNSP